MAVEATLADRSLPHSIEAERAVLGAILLDNELYYQAVGILTEHDFHHPGHRTIFRKMAELVAGSQPIDPITLHDALTRSKELEAVGGTAYLSSLLEGVPRIANLEPYARLVREKSILRQMIRRATEVLEKSYAAEEEASALLDEAQRSFLQISQEYDRGNLRSLQELLVETVAHVSGEEPAGPITGIPTGFIELDEMTLGLQPSDLIILAGRPGMGKTSLALNIALHAALEEQRVVGVFSLEMSAEQLAHRLLSSEARVDSHKLRSRYLSHAERDRLMEAGNRLSQARMFIDDTPGLSVMEMHSKARRLKAEHGLDLIVVDYLQLMTAAPGGRQRFDSRQLEISYISRHLKLLAKELDVAVLALSQLSRAPEQRRGDHRPQLSDLRDSGSIEQDADVVLFVYRPELYVSEPDEDIEGIAEIIIGKQRNGPIGTIRLVFIKEFTKFANYTAREEF
ncbi:MAG: replicative DNA helicase [Acidobacteriota bacterium]